MKTTEEILIDYYGEIPYYDEETRLSYSIKGIDFAIKERLIEYDMRIQWLECGKPDLELAKDNIDSFLIAKYESKD